MRIDCPTCGQHYDVEDQNAGSTANCVVCQTDFPIPAQETQSGPVLKTTAPHDAWRPPVARNKGGMPSINFKPAGSFGSANTWRFLWDVRIFLGWLADGSLIRNVTAGAIYLSVSLVALVCLYVWIQSLKVFDVADGFIGLLGALLWVLFFPYSCFLAATAAFARASEIRRLPSGQFAISPILSILFNLQGEIFFILCAAWSVPVALLVWGCYTELAQFFELPLSDGFLLGVAIFMLMWIAGYSVYLITRWIQEMIYVFPSMAHNLDLVEKHLGGKTECK